MACGGAHGELKRDTIEWTGGRSPVAVGEVFLWKIYWPRGHEALLDTPASRNYKLKKASCNMMGVCAPLPPPRRDTVTRAAAVNGIFKRDSGYYRRNFPGIQNANAFSNGD